MTRWKKLERVLFYSALACLVWGFAIEPTFVLVERKVEIRPAGWPAALDGMRIAAISDLHVGTPFNGKRRMKRLVARVNAAEPDAIILLGDYVIHGTLGGRFVSPEETAEILAGLKAPLGVYAVLGNHDWWLDRKRVREAFASRGITVLENETAQIRKDGGAFRLLGLSDYWEGDPDAKKPLKDVPAGETVVALVHEPDIFPELPDRVALTLAGHTHGGQVRLPFVGSPIVPSRFGQRYARGLIREGEKQMFVTTGVGTSVLPVRFGVPPEYVVLTLRP